MEEKEIAVNEEAVVENEEISEELREELKEEILEEIKKENKPRKTKRKIKKVIGIILDILAFLLLIFIIVETYLGYVGFNKVKDNKTPDYYRKITEGVDKDGNKTLTYDFGLYKAVKVEDNKQYAYKLLPFFLD